MLSHKGYVYCLKPSPEQLTLLSQHFGHVHFVKNWAISLKSRYYKMHGKGISKRQLQDQLVKKKQKPAFAWLNEGRALIPSATLLMKELLYGKTISTSQPGGEKFDSNPAFARLYS